MSTKGAFIRLCAKTDFGHLAQVLGDLPVAVLASA